MRIGPQGAALVVWSVVALGPAHGAAQAESSAELQAEAENRELRARALFELGREAFDVGHFAQALERFEAAYALSPRPQLLYNIGLAADRLREDARALEAFERYLAETPALPEHAAERRQVTSRVEALRAARDREDARTRSEAPTDAALVFRAGAPAQDGGDEARDDRRSVFTRWWFWTGVAMVVAGGVTAAVLLTRPEADSGLPDPNTGVVVPTLRWGGP